MRNSLRGLIFLGLILSIPGFVLAQQLPAAKNSTCCPLFEEAKTQYLSANQYNEFIDFLNNYQDKDRSAALCLAYYKAYGRYQQLQYLEEQQSWDDYFANGNTYREQIVENALKAASQSDSFDCLKVKSRLLLWQFHSKQQDALAAQALDDLIADTQVYAQQSGSLDLIKEVADELLSGEEKLKARSVYKLYVEGLLAQKMEPDQLKAIAAGFYKQGNLELAQSIYDLYIAEISKIYTPEKLIPELFEIASLFVYKPAGFYELAYAEKIYAQVEALGQKDAFGQDTIYLRAFNLEKMNAYSDAQKYYLQLIQGYPDSRYFDESVYKTALISAYALADIDGARKYFQMLAAENLFSPHVISAFYQLGLLSQWEGNLDKAKEYYDLAIMNAKDKYAGTVEAARERLKEIQENKPINYNLKTFLDLSLQKESALLESNKAELKSSVFILEKNQNNTVSAQMSMPQSGCMQVELQYLWSGDLGGALPEVTQSSVQSAYADSGTKEIGMVVISPSGMLDRAFIMLDVY